jgi:hypothetical protein
VKVLAIAILSSPHNAIAGARMFGPDKHGRINPLRVLLRADCRLSLVDWDHRNQAERKRITTACKLPLRWAPDAGLGVFSNMTDAQRI